MVVRLTSKFDLKRLCKALGATALARLGAPIPDEMGQCDEVHVEEIGSEKVTIFKKDSEFCGLSTIILRGSTMNLMDDIERALDDGVNCFKCLIKDGRFCPGAGSTEMILSNILEDESKKLIDLN